MSLFGGNKIGNLIFWLSLVCTVWSGHLWMLYCGSQLSAVCKCGGGRSLTSVFSNSGILSFRGVYNNISIYYFGFVCTSVLCVVALNFALLLVFCRYKFVQYVDMYNICVMFFLHRTRPCVHNLLVLLFIIWTCKLFNGLGPNAVLYCRATTFGNCLLSTVV
jgi:hypothetical protein